MENIERMADIPASIAEIVDIKKMKDSDLFFRYKDKTEIGVEIFKELISRFNPKQKGFVIDDVGKEVGLLSQCQSLQALLLLTSSYNLDFDTVYPNTKSVVDETGKKTPLTIRMVMDMVIEDIIGRLTGIKDEELDKITVNDVVFDSSPYISSAFDTEYAYIDCVTWVIPTFLLVLNYHVKKHEICRFERQLIAIIKKGLNYINQAYIPIDEDIKDKKLTCGWNFTKDCEEPSLYFTFAVAECYVDLYTTFGQFLKDLEAQRKVLSGIPMDADTAERIRDEREKFENINKSFSSIRYEKGEASFFGNDEYNELRRLYMEINDGKDDFSSRYGELEKMCKQVGLNVWELVKNKFADYFFYNDLHATITEDEIKMSTTNDALFNSMYIINILLDTGIDEDIDNRVTALRIELEQKSESKDEALERKLVAQTREYNNLLEVCQLALQKAIRTYENLKNDSREYIVDQFLVGFNEKLEKLEAKVRELRKLRIRIFSLVPLFIKTNSVISEYLIRYPQSSMKKYLGYIMDNRLYSQKDGKASWIWEKDGFFSASNYYYVSALGEFYAYYEQYELDFIDKEETRNRLHKELKETEDSLSLLTRSADAQKKESDEIIAKQQAEIAALKNALDNFETPVEDAVRELIKEEMSNAVPLILSEFLSQTSTAFAAKAIDRNAPDLSQTQLMFKKAFGSFMMANFASAISRNTRYFKDLEPAEAYKQISKLVGDDFSDIAENYIHSICSGEDSRNVSNLKKLLDSKKV